MCYDWEINNNINWVRIINKTERILAPRLCDSHFGHLGVTQSPSYLYSGSSFAQNDWDCQKHKSQGTAVLFFVSISFLEETDELSPFFTWIRPVLKFSVGYFSLKK